jgi:hypothetical protein
MILLSEHLAMVDPTDIEIAAIQAASGPAGNYLDSIGKTDLAQLTEDEWRTFLEVVVTAFQNAMAKLQAGPLIEGTVLSEVAQ